MRARSRHGWIAIVALVALFDRSASAQLMSLPGQFSVTATGAATYSIPIAVPPGTAGMVPALSLDYSNQGGNGILGIGWSLGGLPAVGRCAQMVAQDGVHGGINYDSNDRFCLDGQRLVAINGGAYGADGTEYRLEVEAFSRIISHGTAGTGPAWFEAHTKCGQIMEFGNTADSQILAQGKTTARSWAVNMVSDTKGNYFTVTYTDDSANGVAYPASIAYTANAAAGLSAYNSVQFFYASRPDTAPLYQAGSLMDTVQRLTNIQTFSGGTLVSTYQLTYQQSTATARSELVGVEHCDGSGTCLPATSFGWTNGVGPYTVPGDGVGPYTVPGGNPSTNQGLINSGNWSGGYTALSADVNGDGKTDVVLALAAASGLYIYSELSNGDGTYSLVPGNPSTGQGLVNNANWSGGYAALAADVNGDGKADIVLVLAETSGLYIYAALSNGDGTYNLVPGNASTGQGLMNSGNWSGGYAALAADVNGDGRADIVLALPSASGLYMYSAVSNGNGTFALQGANPTTGGAQINSGNWSGGYSAFGADVNGDGKTDVVLVLPSSSGLYMYSALSNGDGTFALQGANPTTGGALINSGNWSGGYTAFPADVNGDGNADVVLALPSSNGLYMYTALSEGNGTFTLLGANPTTGGAQINSGNWSGGYTAFAGDVNGDGRADVILELAASSGLYIYAAVSNGNGTYNLVGTNSSTGGALLNSANWSGGYTASPGDVNGDGKTDIVLALPESSGLFIYTAMTSVTSGAPADFLATVTTGLGASSAITYAPLTSSAVYTKDNSATYPQQDIEAALYVTSRVDAANGIGGSYSSTYSYAGAKLDLSGRGFLGFRQKTVTDLQTNIVQTANYRQDFPYIGLIGSGVKAVSGGPTLNSSAYSYQLLNAANAATVSAPSVNSAPYRVSQSQSVELSADLDGTQLPTVTTTYQYDPYNNPTQIAVSTPDGASKTTSNTYTNDTTNWFLGRLTGATVTSSLP